MGLYGPDGTLQRYTRAGKRLHEAVNKMRGPTDAEVEAVSRALAKATNVEATWPHWRDRARAAIIALDEVRGR